MSYFGATVVSFDKVEKHPNSDFLSLLRLEYPFKTTVVFNTKDWEGETKAVYIQPDSVMPFTEEWSFLGDKRLVTAKKFRGIMSDGMLVKAKPEWQIGQDVKDELGIKKFEHLPQANTQFITAPPGVPTYTDIESLKKYHGCFEEGEYVILTEKVEGENFRLSVQDKIYVGSRTNWYAHDGKNQFSTALSNTKRLLEVATAHPNLAFYGERYGMVKHFKYEAETSSPKIRLFDIYSIDQGRYLDFGDFREFCLKYELETSPVIYEGLYLGLEGMRKYAEGQSLISPTHILEGFVMRPEQESYHDKLGRKILKLAGDGYLLKKGKLK